MKLASFDTTRENELQDVAVLDEIEDVMIEKGAFKRSS